MQSPHNDSRLSDSEFERLLAAAGSDPGGGSRLVTLASAEQRLFDSVPASPSPKASEHAPALNSVESGRSLIKYGVTARGRAFVHP